MSLTITILGSTGSIGVSTLRVLRTLKEKYSVYGLSCHKNLVTLEAQIKEFNPGIVAVTSDEAVSSSAYKKIKTKYGKVEFLEGQEGLIELTTREVHTLVSAIVGSAGLAPTLSAIPHIKRLAIANKETLVMAGAIFMDRVKEHGIELIPVDSEHNAIFSLIQNVKNSDIKRIILTASGGSFKDKTIGELKNVTPEEALAHPTWDMGDKITIDSATLMNKGFEVIESRFLFDIDYDRINVVIHPESVVHSMVETIDGTLYAHMGIPDMAFPILNALTYPEKRENPFGTLDLTKIGTLNFKEVDEERYPALPLCYNAGKKGGTLGAVLNAANEVAVNAFLNKKIFFPDIIKIVEKIVKLHNVTTNPDLQEILDADKWAKDQAKSMIKGLN